MLCFENEFGSVKYIETPWDGAVLGCSSIQLTEIDSSTNQLAKLIQSFDFFAAENGYRFISTRIPAQSTDSKSALISNGYRVVEHTLDVTINKINTTQVQELMNRFPVQIVDSDEKHILDLKNIASNAFHFGHFFEDPFIPNDVAIQRNEHWIDNLISQQAKIQVLLKKDVCIGFMAWKNDEDEVKLEFGGVLQNFQHLSYSFWAHVLNQLAAYNKIQTTISSSNTGVLNLYSYFGCQFNNPQFGFHKFLD